MKSQTARVAFAIVLCLTAVTLWRWWPADTPNVAQAAGLSANANTSFPDPFITICGPVTAFQSATVVSTGSITIGGVTLTLAAGSSVGGFSVGANVCATFCQNAEGLVTNLIGGVTANAGNVTTVCGTVTDWRPWESLTISGKRFRLEAGQWISGQTILAPTLSVCLFPVYTFDGRLTVGTSVTHAPGTLPIRIPAIVHGTTYGPNGEDAGEGVFQLPYPFILEVQKPVPAGVEVRPVTGYIYTPYNGLNTREASAFCSTTPNSTVRATACADSLWDLFFRLQTSGATDGDMITLALQNPDGSNVQVLAMFTIQNGTAVVTQMHPDVTMRHLYAGGTPVKLGTAVPLFNQGQELRSETIVMAFAMNSPRLDGCFQYFTEIKRAGGAGTTCITHVGVVVKRKEQSGDRMGDHAMDIESGAFGWFPTMRPCQYACNACLPPPPVQPLPGSLSGYVYCDLNNDGVRQADEPGIANVAITLTGVDISGAVNKNTATNDAGFYIFPNLMPGVYKITETQPPNTTDGQDTVGTLGGTTTNDMFANIPLPSLGKGENYNFGEICATATPTPTPTPTPGPMPPKCDTVCWRSTQSMLNNTNNWPGGTVLAAGYNANNPISVRSNVNTIRNILNGGYSAQQKLNREFVTAQMSLLFAGGPGSPVVFNVFWSPLRCSNIEFAPVTLSNGVTLDVDSLLDTLMTQTVLAIKDNRSQDYDELAAIWARLNGKCGVL